MINRYLRLVDVHKRASRIQWCWSCHSCSYVMTLAPPETACLEFPGALSGASEQVTCKSLGDISALSSHAVILIPQSLSSLVFLKSFT